MSKNKIKIIKNSFDILERKFIFELICWLMLLVVVFGAYFLL